MSNLVDQKPTTDDHEALAEWHAAVAEERTESFYRVRPDSEVAVSLSSAAAAHASLAVYHRLQADAELRHVCDHGTAGYCPHCLILLLNQGRV